MFTLFLREDKLCLKSSVTDAKDLTIDHFKFAFLNKNGDLKVTMIDGKDQMFHNVKPDNNAAPQNCKSIAFFGLETQIVIFIMTEVKQHYHFKTASNEYVADCFTKKFPLIKRLPNHDVLIIIFNNGGDVTITAKESDCLMFLDVLTQREMNMIIDSEKEVVVLKDTKTKEKVDSFHLSVRQAKEITSHANRNRINHVTCYSGPLSFRNSSMIDVE